MCMCHDYYVTGTNVFLREQVIRGARSDGGRLRRRGGSAQEVFTLDIESDPEMISDDDDDFQPFALLDFGDDVSFADGVPFDDIFAHPIQIHDHLIIGHPNGEHLVAPILDVAPLVAMPPEDWPFDNLLDDDFDIFVGNHPTGEQGDGEVDDVIVLDVPSLVVSVIDISSDSSIHSVADSYESVTSSALQAAGLRLYATDDDDAMSAAASSPVREPTPPPTPDHVPDPDLDPSGVPPVALLVPQPPPTVDVPPPFVSDDHRTDLPIVFDTRFQLPAQGRALLDSRRASTHLHRLTSHPFHNSYHPSHHVGYTRDDLLLSLQLQFEILSRRVVELELTPPYPPSVSPFTFVPPSATSTSTEGFDVRFLTVEQQISYLVCRIDELEEELTYIRSLIFIPPPPPPSAS
ncbi:hypothetical protein Hanom_Chr06g00547451 [Helianthus anomalus]